MSSGPPGDFIWSSGSPLLEILVHTKLLQEEPGEQVLLQLHGGSITVSQQEFRDLPCPRWRLTPTPTSRGASSTDTPDTRTQPGLTGRQKYHWRQGGGDVCAGLVTAAWPGASWTCTGGFLRLIWRGTGVGGQDLDWHSYTP